MAAPPPANAKRGAPSPAGPAGGGDAETAKRGLISLNNLDYQLPPDLSIVTSRTMMEHHFHTNQYTPGQRMVCLLNSGAGYIDPQNSYLTFQLRVTHPEDARVGWGAGSAVNLFKTVQIVSRSGDEIERFEDVYRVARDMDYMQRSPAWFRTVGAMIGYNDRVSPDNYIHGGRTIVIHEATPTPTPGTTDSWVTDLNAPKGTVYNWVTYANNDSLNGQIGNRVGAGAPVNHRLTTREVLVPLSCISNFFRTTDKLIPAALASGLRIEIELNEALRPFVAQTVTTNAIRGTEGNGAALTTVTYEILNPRVVCDTYMLTDAIQRAMNETIASTGLEMPFVAVHHSEYGAPANATELHVEVRKAVSRALCVISKTQPTDLLNTLVDPTICGGTSSVFTGDLGVRATTNNNFDGSGVRRYQARVGSLYFPHQPINSRFQGSVAGDYATNVILEMYHHTVRGGMSAFKRPNTVGNLTPFDFMNGAFAIWTDLERSSSQNLTGIPINNSRVVELSYRFDNAANLTGNTLHVFLKYVRLVRVFLNNVEVEE